MSAYLVRPPAVAGTFYPSDALVLRNMVDGFLQTAVSSQTPLPQLPKAIIAPHAGYIYSGAIAGSAYKPLQDNGDHISRVILLGPAHRMAIRGVASVAVDAMATPLGDVEVDQAALQQTGPLPQLQLNDAAHAHEHGLEVHLPFLQTILPNFKLVPLLVGDSSGAEVAEVLDVLWGGMETLIVVSSDLSHFYDYETAVKLDKLTAQAILNLQPRNLGQATACGRLPIQELLLQAQQKKLSAHLLDLRNSGDTAGSKDRVVGYGAFAFVGE